MYNSPIEGCRRLVCVAFIGLRQLMEKQNPAEIVLAVPGNWLSRAEIVTSVARKSRGYRFAGDEIFNNDTQESFEVEVAGHDSDLAEAFLMAAPGQLTRQET